MPKPNSSRLSDALPAAPLSVLEDWMAAARDAGKPNPNAMTLATIDAGGAPAARIVLCKDLNVELGRLVFYTNYQSDKGEQLTATPRAAAVFHFDQLGRQVRVRGPVVRSPAAESDAYYDSRHRGSRLGAWASQQSRPVTSREALLDQMAEVQARFGEDGDVPRPPHWGGFRLWADEVELWADGEHRIHDRARWTRALTLTGDQADAGPWHVTRLQP